jgi:16S rRNA (cytidine1402-2'-O)-methyltransferase
VANGGAGRLYVVATPIGNLGDFSPRAGEILRECSLIAAEDTRRTGLLLRHFGISTPLTALHDHNEAQRSPELIEAMRQGALIALVSDAGTPGISDPGYDLVRGAAAAGINVLAIPGPCAAMAALSIAALPTDRFCFEGFLPARGTARRARLESLTAETRTLIFYESPHRVTETLADCAAGFGGARRCSVAREITKLHETVYRGTLAELCALAQQDADFERGEIVLVIEGAAPRATPASDAELERVLGVLLAELPLKQAAALAARILGVRDNEAYKLALRIKQAAAT